MDDYISKPIQPQRLYDVIQHVMSSSGKEHEDIGASSSDVDVFDQHNLLQRVDGDEELVYELIQLFLQDAPQRMSALEVALEKRDVEQLVQVIHTLKGSAGNLCAKRLSEATEQFEIAARKGNQRLIPSLFVQVQHEMSRLLTVLKAVIPSSR